MLDRKNKIQTGNMGGALKSDGSEMGQIRIHENVIASIVRKTACSINGVKRIAGSHFVDNIAEIIGSRKIGDRAISVNLDGNNVSIEVKLNLTYGSHIPTVASQVQSSITSEV
ncbi:MAG TPA: Asp23/Gls24 family envelope stress response protein, partial [Victivallales bacterium]|nr:Asp23/Gls24 family envelope stress response protein [Victivallales bacterium]